MKFCILLVAASLLSFGQINTAEAQILNRLKKKAQEAAAQKAEEKLTEQVQRAAEDMVEKSWNGIFGEFNEDSLSGGQLPFTMNSNVKTEDEYRFTIKTSMKITTTKKDGTTEPPVIMHMFFSDEDPYTGSQFESEEMNTKDGELFIIYDLKNSAMLMLMDNNKDKFSFVYDWKQALATTEHHESTNDDQITDEDVEQMWPNYSKIGSKTILGYDCEGYQSENEDQKVELWISKDANLGMTNLFQAHGNTKQLKNKLPADYPQGMIMNMTIEDLSNNEKTTMNVIAIDKNDRTKFTMNDYPAMSFGLKKNQGK